MSARLRRYASRYRGFSRETKIFLVSSFLTSAVFGLFMVNFNLYLDALGFAPATIGLVATTLGLSLAAAAVPASMAANRIGRRLTMLAGASLVGVALIGFVLLTSPAAIFSLTVVYGVGQQLLLVPASPFLTEHSIPEQRNEVFALNAAVFNGAQVLVGLTAGLLVGIVAVGANGSSDGVATFHVLILAMIVLVALAIVLLTRLTDDRRRIEAAAVGVGAAESLQPAYPTPGLRHRLSQVGIHVGDVEVLAKLIVPGFLIAIGAGQVLPFLNLYIVGRFGLDLSATNAVFAVTALGTMIAILIQPVLARRYGKIHSVVMVQGASIPFIAVLGFAPMVWLVIIAMTVRNSLMNASNPIFSAFAMEQVKPLERATVAATMSLSWSVGWAIGGIFYSIVHGALGFERGYNLNFITIIVLYSAATALYWLWFGRAERDASHADRAGEPRLSHAPTK